MGFLSGRVAFTRYRIAQRSKVNFGPEHLERLATHAIGRQRVASGDGVEAGWIAGDHILDTQFDLAKNIVDDTLQLALRVDSLKIPGDLLRAYTQVELAGLAAGNPSGHPSARQKREARATARDRLEKEASDGRFIRRKAYPILWDAPSRELFVGSTAVTVIDRLHTLFKATFGFGFEKLGAGERAFHLAELRQQTRGVDDAEPAAFVPGVTPTTVAWIPDEANRDFLGNEFLLWLWYVLDTDSDTVVLSDDSEVTAMLTRTLVLECPRGQTGRQSITSDGPGRLPETRRAIRAGKMPRKAGLTLVRQDRQYELTLHAESLSVTGAKLPATEADEERARQEERVGLLRHLVETLDLLYDAFGRRRFGSDWSKELARMQKWLQRDDRGRLSAMG
jgi:hypothetical protein